MDQFYRALAQCQAASELKIPPGFIFAGGNPSQVRGTVMNTDTESQEGQLYIAQIFSVVLAVNLFGTAAVKIGQLKRAGSFSADATNLAKVAYQALGQMKNKAGHSLNAIASSFPEVSAMLIGGKLQNPQPSLLQLALKPSVKDGLRASFEAVIGARVLGREGIASE